THISQASSSGADKGTSSIPGVPDAPIDESEEELSWNSTDDEGADDEGKDGGDDEEDEGDDGKEGDGDDDNEDDDGKEETKDEESFDPIPQTPENSDDEDLGLNISGKEGHIKEEEEDELYRDVNSNQGRGIQETLDVEDSHVTLTQVNPDGQQYRVDLETTSQLDVQTPNSVAPLPISAPTMMPPTIATTTTTSQAPILPTTFSSNIIQNLPNFGSLFHFDDRLRSLEAKFSKAMQTNQFARAVSAIPEIIHRYMDQRMNEAVKVAVQIQSDRLRDEAQRDNDEFFKTVNENMQKIIKEQVKEQVQTSYAVAADLSEMELKKILIEKMEGNKKWKKSIQRSDEQRNLYKALVKAYESDKIILDTYGEIVTLKRRRDDDADKDEEPSAGPDRGSTQGSRSGQASVDTLTPKLLAGPTYELMKGSCKSLVELEYHLDEVFKATTDPLDWVNPEESAYDVYSKRRVITVTELKIVEWHGYKHLDWISVRKDDDKLYKFKEGDFKRLHIQDIEDMLLLLRRVEDLQLGVESYQKKLNLTKPDSYRSNLKCKEAYTAYFNPRGFIYQNKDKRNMLMWIDELHKFSNGTLTNVRTALDDHLKGIQMQYLPQSIWRKSDKDRAAAMIQAIDKRLKTRRIMRSLERFVRGRLYEGEFRMLQRTI
nr:hypothetical protein [Tanacetum cinerariifolium]